MPETPIEISNESEISNEASSLSLSQSVPTPDPPASPLSPTGFLHSGNPESQESRKLKPSTTFKDNSNIFVFNGPLYFSISGGSFEMKPAKSRKLISALTKNLSPLAEKLPESENSELAKPEIEFPTPIKLPSSLEFQDPLKFVPVLPGSNNTKGASAEVRSRTASSISDVHPKPISDDDPKSISDDDPKLSDDEPKLPDDDRKLADEPRTEALLFRTSPDPRIQLAEFFQKAERYFPFEVQSQTEHI